MFQLSGGHASHISSFSSIDTQSLNKFPSTKGTQPYMTPFTVSTAPLQYSVIEKSDVHSHTGKTGHRINSPHDIGYTGGIGNTYPYSPVSTHHEKIIPTTIPRRTISVSQGESFNCAESVVVTTVPSSVETEVITKPNFVLQPIVETIQRPEFLVQENVLGVIQKPEFVIREIPEVLSKPEFLVQEEVVGTLVKPTFVIEEQVSIVQKPEFVIEEDVEVIVKPEFQIQEVTEVIPKPTFVVEENVVSIQKPTFAIQSSQEVVQKPDIVISPVPVTVRKPDYQIAENIIVVAKPSFLVQETQERVIKPEFVVTEEVVPVPRPNFLVQEQVQVVQKPNFQVQDVIQTVQKPEYSVQESTVVVQKPDFFIEEVTETVVKPTFVEQEVAETVISPHYVVEDELVTVTRPQFVVEETDVPVVKPEFFIEEVSEVVPKPQYVVEDVSVAVEKPTYVLLDTQVIVPKPNYVIEETIETVAKPKYNVQERVEIIKKPEFVVQDKIVATIIKPKFLVVSSSNPKGEVFNSQNYVKSGGSPSADAEPPVFIEIHNLQNVPEPRSSTTGHVHHIAHAQYLPSHELLDTVVTSHHALPTGHHHVPTSAPHAHIETVIIPPSLRPQIVQEVEEFSHSSQEFTHPAPVTISHSVQLPEFHEDLITPLNHAYLKLELDEITPLSSHIHAKTCPISPNHHSISSGHSMHRPPIVRTQVVEVTPGVLPHPLNLPIAQHHTTTAITPVNNNPKNNMHGLQVIGNKLGYEVAGESIEFMAPKLKVKKNTDMSDDEELFEWMYAHHDLVENGQFYLEAGIPHPQYGYLFQDQEARPIRDEQSVKKDTDTEHSHELEDYDCTEKIDFDSPDDDYFV